MSNDNYPAGVTDTHPHFNPSETYLEVECETEEATVVPSFAIKAALAGMQEFITRLATLSTGSADDLGAVGYHLARVMEEMESLERDGEYECQWKGEMELPVSEDAEWDCPRCGQTNTTDTLPDERDPDEDRDDRYDD